MDENGFDLLWKDGPNIMKQSFSYEIISLSLCVFAKSIVYIKLYFHTIICSFNVIDEKVIFFKWIYAIITLKFLCI